MCAAGAVSLVAKRLRVGDPALRKGGGNGEVEGVEEPVGCNKRRRNKDMSDAPKWKETEGYWVPDHTLLRDEELGKCARAYGPEGGDFPSPVPTRMGSNVEDLSIPQTKRQKQGEARS